MHLERVMGNSKKRVHEIGQRVRFSQTGLDATRRGEALSLVDILQYLTIALSNLNYLDENLDKI